GPAARRPVPSGRAAAADPAADVPALRGRVTDVGPAPLPAAGRGRGGSRGPTGVLGGDRGRARLCGSGAPDHGLPRRHRPDPGGLRRRPAPDAGTGSPRLILPRLARLGLGVAPATGQMSAATPRSRVGAGIGGPGLSLAPRLGFGVASLPTGQTPPPSARR